MLRLLLTTVIPVLSFVGCKDSSEGRSIPTAPAHAPSERADYDAMRAAEKDPLGLGLSKAGAEDRFGRRDFDGLRLTIPDNWESVALSGMERSVLMARFIVDNDPRVMVTVSRAGGGIEANFARWTGQFSGGDQHKERLEIESDGTVVRLMELTGSFRPGFGRAEEADWVMLGAAVPVTGDDYYLKLTGPMDKIVPAQKQLRDVLRSAVLD